MNKTEKSLKFKIVDAIYIIMAVLPLVGGIILKLLTSPPSEGITVTGAKVFFTLSLPFKNLPAVIRDFPVTESQVNSALVIITILFVFLFMTHGMTERITLKRQHLAEMAVEKIDGLVKDNMGEYFMSFSPFVIAVLALSAFSSLTSLLGLYAPTSDINIVGGWAILVFAIITYYKFKCGPLAYLKGFTEPVALLAPINFVSEFATPVSMAFRHYGNVLSGSVISVLIAAALSGLTSLVLGWLPGFLADIPFLQIGIPAVLSAYFDVFSGLLQAFIFAMLTMVYISGAFDPAAYAQRKAAKSKK